MGVKHFFRVLSSRIREARKGRSPKWKEVRMLFLILHPTCAACGDKAHMQVHHIQPFHEHPELELDSSNLLSLCEGRLECHLRIGHGGEWIMRNPNVVADAAEALANPASRRSIEVRAMMGHLR